MSLSNGNLSAWYTLPYITLIVFFCVQTDLREPTVNQDGCFRSIIITYDTKRGRNEAKRRSQQFLIELEKHKVFSRRFSGIWWKSECQHQNMYFICNCLYFQRGDRGILGDIIFTLS